MGGAGARDDGEETGRVLAGDDGEEQTRVLASDDGEEGLVGGAGAGDDIRIRYAGSDATPSISKVHAPPPALAV